MAGVTPALPIEPLRDGESGTRLSNLVCAPLAEVMAEVMGRVPSLR